MDERDEEEERPPVVASRQVEEVPHRPEADLLVEVQLQRRLAHTGLEHAAHVVVPGEPILGSQRPVGCPIEAGGVHVRGQPLLEAVQLIGAKEVHLPRGRRAIAGGSQVVRERRDGGRQLGAVVVRADPRGELPGQQRGA